MGIAGQILYCLYEVGWSCTAFQPALPVGVSTMLRCLPASAGEPTCSALPARNEQCAAAHCSTLFWLSIPAGRPRKEVAHPGGGRRARQL